MSDLLAIYLNDHLAGSTAGVELSRRLRRENEGTDFEPQLATLSEEVAEDREALRAIMARLRVPESQVKAAFAWTLEKITRLKLNGRLTGYSPLSRLTELEALAWGVDGKISGWRTLLELAQSDRRLDPSQLEDLIARGERQRATLEELRVKAARLSFGGSAR
jgi:hypothetical protein